MSVVVIINANSFNRNVRVDVESFLLSVDFISEGAGCLDIAIMLQELKNLKTRDENFVKVCRHSRNLLVAE